MRMAYSFTLGYDRVTPRPRWGFGQPPHPRLTAILESRRAEYEAFLDALAGHRAHLHAIAHDPDAAHPTKPHWKNDWFSALDAAALMGMLLTRKPNIYVEIGSGHSTMFAAHTIRSAGLKTVIKSIDPQPRAEIDSLCDFTVRGALEYCAPDIFDELGAGDILFFDGSHRVFQNSDVTAFFLEVLPRLKPGVIVHIHDIFLPCDYPPEWAERLFSEQYMLAAMMLCGDPPFRVLLPNYFVSTDPALSARLREIFRAPNGGVDIPLHYANAGATPGVSFWLETR